MASLYRLTPATLLNATSRKVLSASFTRSAIQSSASLAAESFESPNVPRIFDIFDAPVRLREKANEPLKVLNLNFLSTTRQTSSAGRSHSRRNYSDALGLPGSLPPPTTFDGPACPPHMSLSTLRKHRLQRQFSSSGRLHDTSVVSFRAFTSQSEPIFELFDGPARITRYPCPSSQTQRNYFACIALAAGLSAYGWLSLEDYARQINDRSL